MAARLSRSTFLAGVPIAAAATRAALAQPAPISLRIGSNPTDGFGEGFYALDMGFFAKVGIDATVNSFANGGVMAGAVAAGALDIGISSVISLANASLHGVPLVYVAGGGMYDANAPTQAICVAKDSPLRDPKELEGKTVGVVGLKDITNLAALAFLRKGGADVSKIQFVETVMSTTPAALESGRVAAAMISEPTLSDAADRIRVFGRAFDAIARRVMVSGFFVNNTWLAKNRDAGKRFADALHETARWANQNHERSGLILQKYSKISDAALHRMVRTVYAESLDPALIDPTLELAAREKFTDKLVPASALIAKL
jgi:NitT/TauT family transport system substrate-binding protein